MLFGEEGGEGIVQIDTCMHSIAGLCCGFLFVFGVALFAGLWQDTMPLSLPRP